MENLFNKINVGLECDSNKNLSVKDSVKVKLPLDENGNYYYTVTKYCSGIAISLDFSILSLDDTYTIKIHCSDGGSYFFENIKPNEILHCDLNTSFWYSTKFTVEIHANNSHNINCEALVDFSF